MNLNINRLRRKIDDYFSNITKQKLSKDLFKAGSEIYSNVDLNILDVEDTGEEELTEAAILFAGEANTFYLSKYEPAGRYLLIAEAFVNANRPRYPFRETNVGSSNQECNQIGIMKSKKLIFQSSAEDSLPWGDQYGYI